MDLTKASLLRDLLGGTELASRTSQFAHSMRRFTTRPSGLMLFGPEDDEPWHLTAHIDDEVTRADIAWMKPSLVRWAPAAGAPPHLSIGLDRLRDVGRGESLLVVSEHQPATALLERVHDVRRRGATVFSIDNGDTDLASLSHESLVPGLLVPAAFGTGWTTLDLLGDRSADPGTGREATTSDTPADGGQIGASDIDRDDPVAGFEMAQHLVSLAVADDDLTRSGWRARLRSFIERVGGDTKD
ncbi:MAG: hypothetical protein ACRDP9_20455 [Kribbellaceae bacterium]